MKTQIFLRNILKFELCLFSISKFLIKGFNFKIKLKNNLKERIINANNLMKNS